MKINKDQYGWILMIQIACPLKRKRIAERKKSDPELRKRLKEFDDYMKENYLK
ncbi:hypothetical protein IGB11_10490 (plasmid) [Ligilactobacillus salivarius]|uniref:hypothetical protein n=1 Tax=Ligilactobacillus salivarius TaxID=1624 RepID=UPI001551FB19|nr:hypothetical protein [Ligilactobacillus salivarius]QXL50588.1 hypothetical protein IGB11_10490 [Ligilactobacillus salivarius]